MHNASRWWILGLALVTGCAQAPPDSQEAHDERMAAEHADDAPKPSPAVAAEPAAPVATSEVVYATVDGLDATGYLARPEDAEGDLPGILLIHEWWGLNDNIRALTRQLAGEGYLALAVDLYGGESATDAEGARALMGQVREHPEPARENLRQAVAYLRDELGATRVGTIGWCFGGGWSLNAALLVPGEIDATVIYYGHVVTERDELAAISAPVLGIFGAEDGGIPVDTVRRFESVLRELGKDARIHVYDGADHAFANPSGGRYHAEAAADAWAKTLAFFAETLKS